MKKFAKIVVIAMLVSVLALAFVACGDKGGDQSGSGQKYTLTVWGAEQDQAMLKEMCNAYAAANPQNTYKFLYGVQSESDAADKVTNDPQNGPDVFSFASDQINKLLQAGALARVGGEILDNIRQVNSAASVDAATVVIDGEERVYAYPSTGDNTYFVYYNTDYVTADDVASLDAMLQKSAELGKKVHFKLENDAFYSSSFFFAFDDLKYEVTYDDAMSEVSVDINYDNENGLKAMQAMRDYANNESLVIATDDTKILNAVRTGDAAIVITGTWNAKSIQEAWGDKVATAKLPTATIGGEQKQLVAFFGYKLIGVNGYSNNKGEAHKLAQWLTNEQNQLKRFQVRGFGPTNKNVIALSEVQNDIILKAVYAQQAFSRTQKGVPANYWTPVGQSVMGETIKTASDADLQALLDILVAGVKGTAA